MPDRLGIHYLLFPIFATLLVLNISVVYLICVDTVKGLGPSLHLPFKFIAPLQSSGVVFRSFRPIEPLPLEHPA